MIEIKMNKQSFYVKIIELLRKGVMTLKLSKNIFCLALSITCQANCPRHTASDPGQVGQGDHGVVGHLVLDPHVWEGGQRVWELGVPRVHIKGRVLVS